MQPLPQAKLTHAFFKGPGNFILPKPGSAPDQLVIVKTGNNHTPHECENRQCTFLSAFACVQKPLRFSIVIKNTLYLHIHISSIKVKVYISSKDRGIYIFEQTKTYYALC